MSQHNTDIQGNASVSRNVSVGGHASIRGNMAVDHNLKVKGWLDAPNIKGPLKGLFASEESLKRSYPRPMPGWYALVGDTLPAAVWRADVVESGGMRPLRGYATWVPTGETGGEVNLYLDRLEEEVAEHDVVLDQLKRILSRGVMLGEGIEFEADGDGCTLCFDVLLDDGSRERVGVAVPMAGEDHAGMVSSGAWKELSGLNAQLRDLERVTNERLSEIKERFDALVGENASEAIDNFREVLAFLEGVKDSERLVGLLTALRDDVSAALQTASTAEHYALGNMESIDEIRRDFNSHKAASDDEAFRLGRRVDDLSDRVDSLESGSGSGGSSGGGCDCGAMSTDDIDAIWGITGIGSADGVACGCESIDSGDIDELFE